MPRLVILDKGPDTAGVGIGLKKAFDRHAVGWETRAVCRRETYLAYETDIVWPRKSPVIGRQVLELVKRADVVHVMDAPGILDSVARSLHGQTVIVHHLGSHFRSHPIEVSAKAQHYGATEVTDSIDLIQPHVPFLPVPADLDALAAIRSEHFQPSKRIRITHAPTHRAIKSTDIIEKVVRSLARRYPIDFDIIEGVSNRECLERKARADIFVDQLLLGFGVNAIECWGMGVPVVSGLESDDAHRAAMKLWGRLPWADATAATLEPVLEHLITDPAWRAMLGARGKAHAEQWHSQQSVVEQALAVYEKARQRLAA